MASRVHTSIWAFPRKERRGVLLLLSVILLLCALPFFLPLVFKESIAGQVNIDSSLARLQAKKETAKTSKKFQPQFEQDDERRPYDHPSAYSYTSYKGKRELFNFDPNTIDEAGWKKLGIRDKTIGIIINYRNKGGRFRQPEDIKKIWGLFPDEAERLLPFVRIEENREPQVAQQTFEKSLPNNNPAYTPKKYSTISINTADSALLVTMPGIAAKLGARIINYRNKLGGFYSVEQVAETFGLPDSTFQKIKPYLQVDEMVKKININTAELDELKAHPYIRYHLANAIVQYRKQHGSFRAVNDLSKIMIMDAENLRKMSPYLTVE